MTHAFIKEIFSSIQGEGLYVGEKQLFIRFCGCNLNCAFCDTDFETQNAAEYSTGDLVTKIFEYEPQTISLTGGEPLLHIDFLVEFLKMLREARAPKRKIYLETNGTLYSELTQIIDLIDVVAMDIKLESATGEPARYLNNEKFLAAALNKEIFIKVIFDKNLNDNEITEVSRLAVKFNTPVILQPKMPLDNDSALEKIFDKFSLKHKNIRLIPQIHKFLGVR